MIKKQTAVCRRGNYRKYSGTGAYFGTGAFSCQRKGKRCRFGCGIGEKNAGEIYKENLISTRENSQHIRKSMEKGKEN